MAGPADTVQRLRHLHRHRNGPQHHGALTAGKTLKSIPAKGGSEPPSTPSVPDWPSPVELVRRGTSTCTDDSSPGCKTGSSAPPASLAIGLGVAVPLVLALIVFVFLHRRHVKKLRQEDSNDPHKSLDFGVDGPPRGKDSKKARKGQEMTTVPDPGFAQSLRRGRGLSMDVGSPYLLPPEIHNSRESLHSLSKNMSHGSHDPYHPAHSIYGGPGSTRSFRMGEDDASSRTGSTRQGCRQDGMNQHLLRNAQHMSQSDSPVVDFPRNLSNSPPAHSGSSPAQNASPSGQTVPVLEREPSPSHAVPLPAPYSVSRKQAPAVRDEPSISNLQPVQEGGSNSRSSNLNALRQSNNYLGTIIQSRAASLEGMSSEATSPILNSAPKSSSPGPNGQPQLPSISVEQEPVDSEPEPYDVDDLVLHTLDDDKEPLSDSLTDITPRTEDAAFYTPKETPTEAAVNGLGVSDVGLSSRPLSIVRPLPPEDPNDNAEQRANRIRSFYKEYFDENAPARAYKAGSADYYEDYGQEYLGDGAIFDPTTGKFIVAKAPYADPVTRRAMTPPPRGPPRFTGQRQHGHNTSGVTSVGARSRAYSSASTSRMGPAPQRGPKRPRPPPGPLRTLPTPHLITEDAFTQAIDFAPPSNFRDQQAGRPQSPFGETRPYSPTVPVASPLASSYLELASMPSPHQLRKSGVFTALDFAPPPRFRGSDNTSDAGSIRSGRSNHSAMSAMQIQSLRAGAYRVSRIPKELVGTRDEFAQALKPSWKVGS